MACTPVSETTKLGDFAIYNPAEAGCVNTDDRFLIGHPLFFGKDALRGKPLYAVVDYDQFKAARMGIAVTSLATAFLGFTTILLLTKKR